MYEKIRDAALTRQKAVSSGAWVLADALAEEVPGQHGARNDLELSRDVPTKLAAIAERLDGDGVEAPTGNAYTANSLRELRIVALAWPESDRHEEAAFRTHQEVGKDDGRRAALAALCYAARTGDFTKPEALPFTEDSWDAAISGVVRKVGAGNRYPVAANDLRRLIDRKVNVPVEPDVEAEEALSDEQRLEVTVDTLKEATPEELRDIEDQTGLTIAEESEDEPDDSTFVQGLKDEAGLLTTLDYLVMYLKEVPTLIDSIGGLGPDHPTGSKVQVRWMEIGELYTAASAAVDGLVVRVG